MAATSQSVKMARKALEIAWNGTLPVNPADIAAGISVANHPVRMIGSPGMGFSGQARFDAEGEVFVCEYNSAEVSYRQRFTQAHELGHVVLGHVNEGRQPKRDATYPVATRDPDEVSANGFAAELLMPADYVRNAVKNEREISRLADLFDVSTTAMRYRLKNLGILD